MLSGREQKNIRVGRKGPDQLHTQMHISCAETPTIGLLESERGLPGSACLVLLYPDLRTNKEDAY